MPPGAALVLLFVFGIWLKHETKKSTHTYIHTILHTTTVLKIIHNTAAIYYIILLNVKLVRVTAAAAAAAVSLHYGPAVLFCCRKMRH